MSAAEMMAGMFRYESREFAGPMQMASSAEWTGRLCASASLYTTTVWVPSSRHARMTRSAISPRFAMRILSNEIERLPQCLGIRQVRGPRVGEDPLHEAGEYVPGAELDERRRALPSGAPHRGDPLYGRVDLFFEQCHEITRMFVRLRIHICYHAVCELSEGRGSDRLGERGSDRPHRG